MTWVGDNRHTWNYKQRGLEGALTDILDSARLGYCVIGSDVAGYHGRSNPKDEIAPNIYIRWAEFSAFCGFFLNGGHGERRLWKRTQPELEIVRKFSWLHTELVPYMYSQVVLCHNGGQPLMRPLAQGKFQYLFGGDFLVAPIHEDKLGRTVALPPGKWRYLFDDRQVLQGPAQLTRDFPLDEFPVFVREGAVVPLKVKRPYTGFGDEDSAEFTTWLVYPSGRSEFTLWHPESHPKPEPTTVKVDAASSLQIEFSGKHEPHLLRIFTKEKPSNITLDGKELAEGVAWSFDAKNQRLIIKTRDYAEGKYLISFQ